MESESIRFVLSAGGHPTSSHTHAATCTEEPRRVTGEAVRREALVGATPLASELG